MELIEPEVCFIPSVENICLFLQQGNEQLHCTLLTLADELGKDMNAEYPHPLFINLEVVRRKKCYKERNNSVYAQDCK